MPFYAGQRLTAGALNLAITHEVRKTATQSVTSSTTLVDDTELFFAVGASTVWFWNALLLYDGAASPNGDLKMQFTGPSGASLTWVNFGVNTSALSAYNVVTEQLTAGSPRAVGTNGGTQMSCRPAGYLTIGSTAGTFRLRWAQNASNATPTRVMAGSVFQFKRVA